MDQSRILPGTRDFCNQGFGPAPACDIIRSPGCHRHPQGPARVKGTCERAIYEGERKRMEQGTLWTRIRRTTEQAVASGALLPIRTNQAFIEEGGIRFLVRVLER